MSEEMPKPAAAVEAVWPMGPGQAAWLKSVELWGPGHAATWDDLSAYERRQWSLIANAGIAGSEYVRGLEALARAAASMPAPELPDDDVHVDWHMTPQEWGAFSFVLGQHADTPYIARLIEAGKVPAPADCLTSHCPPSAHTDCEYPKCAPDAAPPAVVVATPTIMDGLVLRWYRNADVAKYGSDSAVLSVSRGGVMVNGGSYLHDIPVAWMSDAQRAHEMLQRGQRDQARELATHENGKLFSGEIVEIKR